MGILSLAFGLILSFVSLQSQARHLLSVEEDQSDDDLDVFVSVHGALLRKKLIILYHDEITYNGTSPTLETTKSQGDVACFGNYDKVRWRSPSGRFLATEEQANYRQIESAPGNELSRFRISQLITPTDGASPTGGGGVIVNGLWICQVDNSDFNDEDILNQFNYVGIYTRGSTNAYDRGAIIVNTVTLVEQFNFRSNPPTFILAGDTRGGPPITNSWTRNGIKLRNNLETHISLGVHGVNTLNVESVSYVLQESRYRSTLTVTGYLPGVYVYSVINQAMIETLTASFTIYGGLLTNLTAEQISLTAVFVSWIAAYDIFEHEFNLMVHFPGGSTETFSEESSSFTFYSTVPGVHTITELYPEHYPVSETMVTVKGHGPSTISVSQSRTFVNITFIPPEFSLPVIQYMVTLSRVTVTGSGLSGQELCPEFLHNIPAQYPSDPSISFTDLEEFSTYAVTLITTFNVFMKDAVDTTPEMRFTTLSAAPDGVPRDVDVLITTSRMFMVSWDTIECIERNGIILRYVVDSNATGNISGMTYSAERLTPGIQYTFRVAGVNDADRGPFTDTITITTNEEVPGRVADFTALGKFTTVDLTWSAPQEPNGVIISYEVTYRINNGTLNTINITASSTTFSIKSLLPQTNVSGLSIRAYTKIGPGEAITTANWTTLETSTVINVNVETLSATAVMVSWDKVDIPEIAGYIVYYIDTGIRNTQSINVTSSVTSVEIEGLLIYADYQFQVGVIAEVDGVKFIGEIEKISLETESTLEVILGLCTRNCEIVVGVVFCYFVIMILVTILQVLYYRHRTYRLKYTSKSRSERVGSSLIYKQQIKDFKIDTDETLEYDQKPDINQPETIDITLRTVGFLPVTFSRRIIHVDETLQDDQNSDIIQQQTTKNDADETLEHDQNPDNNQLQTTDIKIDETLECARDQDIDINQLKKSDFKPDADEALEYSQNSDNQQQTIDSSNDADETLEHDQNPDNQLQTTDIKIDETLECARDQNIDINQLKKIDFKTDADEALECSQNSDNQQQTIDSRIESLDYDQNQNPVIAQLQTTDTDFNSNANETLEHDQNPDINQQQTEIECAETLEHDQNQDVEDDHNDD